MVTETPDEQQQPIGAIAALGGRVEDLFMEVKQATTAGHRKVFWPMVLLLIAFVPVILNVREQVALLASAVSLLLLAVWVVADDARKP